MVEPVLAVVSDVEVVEAVVVVVACADSLSPAARSQPGLLSHVGKAAIVIVVEQMIGGSGLARRHLKGGAVDDEDVGPAIIVIIKDGDAGAGGFDDVLFTLLVTGDDLESQACLLGDILEVRDR